MTQAPNPQVFHLELEAILDKINTCVPVLETKGGAVAIVSAKNFEKLLRVAGRDRDSVQAREVARAGKPAVWLMPEPVFDELHAYLKAARRLRAMPAAGRA